MTKAFLTMLVAAAILGVALGGAFIGGVVLGRSQSAGADQEGGLERLASRSGTQPGAQQGRQGFGAPQGGQAPDGQAQDSRARPGAASGQTANPPSQVPGSSSGRDGQPGAAEPAGQDAPRQRQDSRAPTGRGGAGGAVESVDGNQLTISTPQGPVTVTVGEGASVFEFSEATTQDLTPGTQVRIMGPPGAEGVVEAGSILIVTEETQGFFGRRPGPRGQ